MNRVIIVVLIVELTALTTSLASAGSAKIRNVALNASLLIHVEVIHTNRTNEFKSSSWSMLDQAVPNDRSCTMTFVDNRWHLIDFEITQRVDRLLPMAIPVIDIRQVRLVVIEHPSSEDVLFEVSEVGLKEFSLSGSSVHVCYRLCV
jgi:hypothetical protein